jgi:hypothetical protein
MNQRAIKVIKRANIRIQTRQQIIVTPEKVKHDTQNETTLIIDGWVLERRATSLAERVFSDESVSAWKKMSSNLKEQLS